MVTYGKGEENSASYRYSLSLIKKKTTASQAWNIFLKAKICLLLPGAGRSSGHHKKKEE